MVNKIEKRLKIKRRIRGKISGTGERPRMSVFRSNKQIYVQIIDDLSGKTLVSASSLGMTDKVTRKEEAGKVGEVVAQKAKEAGMTTVVFELTVLHTVHLITESYLPTEMQVAGTSFSLTSVPGL